MPTSSEANAQFQQTTARMFEDISKRLTEFTGSVMRTREDVVKLDSVMGAIGKTLERIESRQDTFEREIRNRLDEQHRRANERMVEIAEEYAADNEKRFSKVEGELTRQSAELKTIREERIAEKSQWRGPEKMIVFLQVGSFMAAIAGGVSKMLGLW